MFDRRRLTMQPLAARVSRLRIEDIAVLPNAAAPPLDPVLQAHVRETARRMVEARSRGRPVVCAFGAHAIKNGLAPVFIHLLEQGWLTHMATNGAGIIHDWEFAFQGRSTEDVRHYVAEGQFGIWDETGRYINLAILVGALDGLGYCESVGRLIEDELLHIPRPEELRAACHRHMDSSPDTAAAALDLLNVVLDAGIAPGQIAVGHPWKSFSVAAACRRLGIPFTGHPMLGHDIIYTHPLNSGAAVGRTGLRDFLRFAETMAGIDGGVYISLGSAVMSPMIFEKAFAMAQNLARQRGQRIKDHYLAVVDLARSTWDWTQGEPPHTDPAYYLRFCKTFSRMGGTMRYLSADNRDFLLALVHELPAFRAS